MIDDAGSDARMHCTTFFSRWIEMYIVYLCIRSIVFGSALYLCIRSIVFGSAWSICFKLLPNIQRHQHNTVLKVKSTKEENDQKPKQNTALLRNTTKQKSKTNKKTGLRHEESSEIRFDCLQQIHYDERFREQIMFWQAMILGNNLILGTNNVLTGNDFGQQFDFGNK